MKIKCFTGIPELGPYLEQKSDTMCVLMHRQGTEQVEIEISTDEANFAVNPFYTRIFRKIKFENKYE